MAENLIDRYRFERKFSIAHMDETEIMAHIKSHPLRFRPIYEPRYINNIYFDTPNMDHYGDTVEGLMKREKYRIRWYGDLLNLAVPTANLEIKIKRNHINRKETFRLSEGVLDSYHPMTAGEAIIASDEVTEDVKQRIKYLNPYLVNRYYRCYFLSANGDFRVTVDTRLQYYGTHEALHESRQSPFEPNVILELKYEFEHDDMAQIFSNCMPLRLTRNSKYVNGIDALKRQGVL